ncbi:MAG: hypothetical protein AAFV77_13180, partial [Planctomycetota bacterium]
SPIWRSGLVHARDTWTDDGPPADFVAAHGGKRVSRLLERDVLWSHLFYDSQDPARLRKATHYEYARRQARYTLQQLREADASPSEIFWAVWLEDQVRYKSMLDIFSGLRDALSEHRDQERTPQPAHHVLVCGDWKLLRGIAKQPIEAVLGPDGRHAKPLQLTIPSEQTGLMLAEAWNAGVAKPFREVFSGESPA